MMLRGSKCLARPRAGWTSTLPEATPTSWSSSRPGARWRRWSNSSVSPMRWRTSSAGPSIWLNLPRSRIRSSARGSTAPVRCCMDRDPRAYLWDVQQAADAIKQFIAGLDAAGYVQNALVRAAVERQFEIIGEALNQLSKVAPDIARRVSDLRPIIGFRNILIHGYAAIDHARVWHIAQTSLPGLRREVSTLLAELGGADP